MKVRVIAEDNIIISNMMISGEFSFGGFSCSYILRAQLIWLYATIIINITSIIILTQGLKFTKAVTIPKIMLQKPYQKSCSAEALFNLF